MKNYFPSNDAYADQLSIYTDGYKDEDKVECAAIHHKLKLIKPLP